MNQQQENQIEDRHWEAIESLRRIESEPLWDSVFALRKSGTLRVLDRAIEWCKDHDPFRRSVGVSILAQFGPDTKAYPHESCAAIRDMLDTEEDPEVISSLISAVHFRDMHDRLGWLLALASHPSDDIRWRVAWALPLRTSSEPESHELSIQTLLRLMNDGESQVRDWATFSIAVCDDDTSEIRSSLLERLSDTDFQTRSEAAIGLARRRVQGGIDPLIEHLKSDRVGELYVEAAELYGDVKLRPALEALKKWWDIDPELLERAIAACSTATSSTI